MANLILITNFGNKNFVVTDKVKVGRSNKCDIAITDKKMSREHILIYQKDNKTYLRDLDSSNGTFVNGEKVTETVITDGDRIRTGKTEFIFNNDKNDTLLGKNLQGYNIKTRIGQGSMGAVYLANQISLDRNVAIKILKKELSKDLSFVARFETEAKIAGKIQHKNVITTHDFGFANSQPFISMEFVKGETLQQIIDTKGPISTQKCIEYCRQIADGIACAHNLEIIHQDIKPLNIMLNEDKVIKIADLGLAKNLKQLDPTDKNNLKIMGTPQYIAPEILKKELPGIKSDIYSLGATIFHMATGQTCFTGTDVIEVVNQRLKNATPIPKKINPNIPQALSDFILKLMEVSPENRPEDMMEVISLIDKLNLSQKKMAKTIQQSSNTHKSKQEPTTISYREKKVAVDKEELAIKKKNKRLAMLIIYLISVGIAGIFSLGIYQLIKPDPKTEIAKNLKLAKELIKKDNDNRALDYLENLLANYPNSKENKATNDLIDLIKRKKRLRVYAEKHKTGEISNSNMRKVLNTFIKKEKNEELTNNAKKLLATLPKEEIVKEEYMTPPKSDEESEWTTLKNNVKENTQKGNLSAACSLLSIFIGNHPDTKEIYEARKMRYDLLVKIKDAFEKKLTKIKQKNSNDEFALWRELEKLFIATEGNFQKAKVHNELSKIFPKIKDKILTQDSSLNKATKNTENIDEFSTFDSNSDSKRWIAVSGSCEIKDDWLKCHSSKGRFRAILTGNLFNQSNSSFSMEIKNDTDKGYFSLRLTNYKNSLSVFISPDKSELMVEDTENPENTKTVKGKKFPADANFKLTVKDGKASLLAGNDIICSINTISKDNSLYRLEVGFIETSGKIKNLIISE